MKFYENVIKRLYEGIELEKDRSPDNRGIKGFVKRRFIKSGYTGSQISIVLNNVCNLNCFSCSAKPNHDLYETSSNEVDIFLENIRKWNPESSVVFSGGEVTLMNKEYLKYVFKITKNHNRKVVLLTNGAKIIDLENVDFVIVDDHIVNKDDVDKWVNYLNDVGVDYYVKHNTLHRDIEYARRDNITKGLRCNRWLKSLCLWKKVVYPCCSSFTLDYWDGNNDLSKALFESGWCYNNKYLYEHIINWKSTIPDIMFRKCLLSCWMDSDNYNWCKTYE